MSGVIHDITEGKSAEIELRNSEERFRATFEQAAIGIAHTALDGMFLRCNQRFADIIGYSMQEIPHLSYQQITVPTYLDESKVAREELRIGTMDRTTFVKRYIRKDGSFTWVRVTPAPLRDSAGDILHFITIVEDINALKTAEEALLSSEVRYRVAFQNSFDGISLVRLDDNIYLDLNQAFATMFGYEREEVVGRTALDLDQWHNSTDREMVLGVLRKEYICMNREVRLQRKDRNVFWALLSAASIEMDGTSCVLFFVRDIDAAKKAEARLAAAAHATSQSEHRYRTVFETSPDSVMITRLEDATVVDVNRTFCQNSGYERTEIVGRKLLDFDHWVDPVERQNMVDLVRRNGSCRDFETRFYTKDRSIHWGLISASTFDLDGEACLLSITRDITDAKENEKKIRKLSFYDPLTNLPNRRLLLEKLRRSLVSVGAKRNRNALILIGLDRFKIVNETLGHPVGDLLLQEVARRMTSCVKNANTIARIGGDEFVVLLRDLSENTEEAASQAKDVSYKILVEISRTYTLGKLNSRCTASIGITIFAEEENAKELLQQVDIAMVQAKAAGRNTMRFFAPHLQAAVNARATMEEDLREAIGTSQFMLYYQPQVENGRVTGAEALVRWKHPSKGFLSPAAFIPLAEETGLILPLGDWVLESACRKIAEWEGHPTASQISVSVNISARQLRQHDFVEQVLSVLERTGANPKRLMLELTESMLVENVGEVIAKMTSLKSTGLSFSLDDFGTGYSSLSYLKRLPLNELKIDLSFVRDILVEASSGVIAETIIALSRAMGMSVIAEGVETEEQREYLARLGCHAYQGYLFSRPLPADDFERMLPESFPATATMIV